MMKAQLQTEATKMKDIGNCDSRPPRSYDIFGRHSGVHIDFGRCIASAWCILSSGIADMHLH